MAFLISDLITKSYYLANILSPKVQTPDTAEIQEALDGINIIFDQLRNNTAFMQYSTELSFQTTQRTVYIGKNLTPVSGVDIVDEDYLNNIAGGRVDIGTYIQELTILGMTRAFKKSFSTRSGTPFALYWAIKLQGKIPYTEI